MSAEKERRIVEGARIAVIGAGIGALACALELSAAGAAVTVLEKGTAEGGKMREVGPDRIAGGPTVFTMKWVFDELFAAAGLDFDAYVGLEPLPVLARHAWDARTRFDLFADRARAIDAVGAFAGAPQARSFADFLDATARVYGTLERTFLAAAKPGPVGLAARIGFHRLGALLALRPFSTLWGDLGRYFPDPRLRQLFGRYATYTGASPFAAPATLMLIAHVEQSGVWRVQGGMQRLAEAMRAAAEARGARFRFGAKAARVEVDRGRASGVTLEGGERIAADAVICNADAAALGRGLFGEAARAAVAPTPPAKRSLSAMVWTARAKVSGFPLLHHTVAFSRDYAAEFEAIRRGQVPAEPTVYLCAQDRDAVGAGASGGSERLQILINAPPAGDARPFDESETERCRQATLAQLDRCGLTLEMDPSATVLTTPADFERLFPATGGALYGRATHGWTAPFARPGARTRLPGLYLAGGGAHPGAGVPMAALSGRSAAACAIADLASTRRSSRAAISGGTPTASRTTAATPSA